MAQTQAKVTNGGSFAPVTVDTVKRVTTADATVTAVVANGAKLQTMQAINEYNNVGGTGDGSLRAAATALASGVTLEFA